MTKAVFFWSLFLTFGDLFCQFQTFSKISSKCLPKLLSMRPQDRFERKKKFFRKNFLLVSRIWIENFLDFRQKNFRWVAEVPLEEPGGTFWEQCYFLKKNLLFQTLRQRRSEKGKIFRLRSLNCIIRDQKNILRKSFLRFEDLYSVNFGLLAKTIQSVCQNCLQWALSIVLEKKIIFQTSRFLSMIFWLRANFFTVLGQKVYYGMSKQHFRFPKKNVFWRRAIFVKTDSFSIHIRNLNQNFFDFCRKKCGRVAKIAFELPKGSFWQKQGFRKRKILSYFSDFKRKCFGTLARSFFLRSLNCILHIQRKIFGFVFEFGWPILSLWDFLKKNSDVFSKLHSMGPRENFFFKKFKLFPSYSDLELIFFADMAEKSCQCGQTSVRCAQRNILKRTMSLQKFLFGFSDFEQTTVGQWQNFLTSFY